MISPLRSHPLNLIHFPILLCLCFDTLLEKLFWDVRKLCYYSLLDGPHTFKTDPLRPLGKEKEQDQVNQEVVSVW